MIRYLVLAIGLSLGLGAPHATADEAFQRLMESRKPIYYGVTGVAAGDTLSPEQQKMLEGLRAAEQARQDEIAQIKADNCEQSRDVLARLTLKNRIRVKGPDGEYTVMPEEERQERISKAQENVALYCVST